MKRAVILGIVLALLPALWARADLQGDVDAVLKDALLKKASVGIELVRLGISEGQDQEIYEHNGRSPLTPASNLKLTTTSAALERLGPDFKFRTRLFVHDGDVVLIGDGDPSFGDPEYLKRVGWKCTTVFENWAGQLKKLNVTSLRDVIVDDSVFDEEFFHAHWPANQLDHSYEAEVSGMNFGANCVSVVITPAGLGARVDFALVPPTRYLSVENTCVAGDNDVQLGRKPGSNDVVLKGQAPHGAPSQLFQTIHDPAMYAATVLSETLQANGIRVTGAVRRDRSIRQAQSHAGAGWRLAGVHETPLAVVIARANKDSVNLYAESLCKRLGHETSKASGSWENGTFAVADFLKHAGIADSEFRLDDGSGLSKHNAISSHALVRVLAFDFHGKDHDAFVNSLSIAGVDGTLEERFHGSDLRRRVIGKSGFVEGVSCLSGFLRSGDDQWYAFAIMMNGIPYKSNSLAKALQERIVKALDTDVAREHGRVAGRS